MKLIAVLFTVSFTIILLALGHTTSAQDPAGPTQTAQAQQTATINDALHTIRETQTALAYHRAITSTAAAATHAAATSHVTASPSNLHQMYVFVRGADGLIYYKHNMQNDQHGVWTDWQWLDVPSGGVTLDPPSVVAQNNGQIDLFVRGNDNALWHRV